MNDKLFDQIIKDRLSEVGSGHQPSGWAYLERRLNADSAAGSETNGPDDVFDDAVRQKLVPSSTIPLMPDWDVMEERLDMAEAGTPQAEQTSIDQAVFEKLNNFQAPYKREHWWKMSDKLDGEFVNAGSVWRSKLVELGLMALLLFTFWQHFPTSSLTGPGLAEIPTFEPDQASDDELLTSTDSDPKKLSDDAPAPRESASSANGREINVASGSLAEALPDGDAYYAKAKSSTWKPGRARYPDLVFAPFAALPSLKESLLRQASLDNPLKARLLQNRIPVGRMDAGAPAMLASRNSGVYSNDAFKKESPGVVKTVRQRPFIHFGMFGSLDYNRIYSPSVRLLDTRLKEFDRYELGYSGGITLGFDLGQWEIQTGAIYSSKQYRPLLAEFWEGDFSEGYGKVLLKDIQLNIVQVPLMLRYNVLHYDSWRLYLMAGASVHVAVSANYFYDNLGEEIEDVGEPNRGWFDGGSFRENSYLTGNVGFGLERYVTPSWSLFAQPTYQHALDFFNHGMGPTSDRISTMSIYTGIRVRLER